MSTLLPAEAGSNDRGASSVPPAATGAQRTAVCMDTIVSIEVPGVAATDASALDAIERAFGWFREVEARCSRFRRDSDIGRLAGRVNEAVPVSTVTFEALRFALAMAEVTEGVFDPTVGATLEAVGFDRNYQTGERVSSGVAASGRASFRDVELDEAARTVTCHAPLVLDLGAVAKGFAVDLAAVELRDFPGFAVNAGGDIRVRGLNAEGEPWRIGIRDPREPEELIELLHLTDTAVCTSAGYERPNRTAEGHHLVDATTGRTPVEVAGVTVVAPSAMLADTLATTAFLLGPDRGAAMVEDQGASALFVLPSGGLVWAGAEIPGRIV
jgi:thiamine biosynthesis lipoprotein